jgi:hypothetical protein
LRNNSDNGRVPTVQVAGETEAANGAVAQHALELTRPASGVTGGKSTPALLFFRN